MKLDRRFINISIGKQTLTVFEENKIIHRYSISTARNGPGEMLGSECTPLGLHFIADMVGQECIEGTVFVGRKPTGEIFSPELLKSFPDRGWILIRIMW
jgi:L,D-transpeptidase YbiS